MAIKKWFLGLVYIVALFSRLWLVNQSSEVFQRFSEMIWNIDEMAH